MTRPLHWLHRHWHAFAAALVGLVMGVLLMRRRPVEQARQLGRAEGRAGALADSLHGEAADLRAHVEAARARDADVDRAIDEAAREAAARDVPPEGVPRIPSVERYL